MRMQELCATDDHNLVRVGQQRPRLCPSATRPEVELRDEHVDAYVLAGVALVAKRVEEGLGQLEQPLLINCQLTIN